MMRTSYAAMIFALTILTTPVVAMPTTVFDADASEWSSLTTPVPGTVLPIGGSGQVNGNFTINTDSTLPGAEIGMRAIERFSPTPLANLGSVYTALAGESTAGLPTWNYDIHIDLRGTGLSFGDFTIEVLSSVPNHSTSNLQVALEAAGSLPPGTLDGVELYQSSLNPGFFASGIDPFASGVETFALTLTPVSGVTAPALGVDITVNIVPEPATLVLAGLGLSSVLLLSRRR